MFTLVKIFFVAFILYQLYKNIMDIPSYFFKEGRKNIELSYNDMFDIASKENALTEEEKTSFDKIVFNIVNSVFFGVSIFYFIIGLIFLIMINPVLSPFAFMVTKITWLLFNINNFIITGLNYFKRDCVIKWWSFAINTFLAICFYGSCFYDLFMWL